MREILFRGFYEYKNGKETIYINGKEIKGKWVYGDLVKCMTDNGECIGIKDTIYEVNTNRCNLIPNIVIPETIGQFTGLTDKNGKKIFEGDIVKLILDNGEIRFFKVSIKKVKRRVISHPNFVDASSYVEITGVVFEWNGFQLFPCVDENGIVDYSKMEIVGNIHDNPELLEVEK